MLMSELGRKRTFDEPPIVSRSFIKAVYSGLRPTTRVESGGGLSQGRVSSFRPSATWRDGLPVFLSPGSAVYLFGTRHVHIS
jgi:hypothetical protein